MQLFCILHGKRKILVKYDKRFLKEVNTTKMRATASFGYGLLVITFGGGGMIIKIYILRYNRQKFNWKFNTA